MGNMGDSGHGDGADGVLDALAAALPRHGLWDAPLLVGVSGGADSVALLLGIVALEPGGASPIRVAHAHHGLRDAADADLAFVEALAGSHGLPLVSTRLPVAEGDGVRGEGLEARARRLRYAWLGEAAHACGARHVLVAHTADDQAETILHRALRGTGVGGLAGMKRARRLVDGVALLRPLLGVRRAALRAWLTGHGQSWREDESNADPRFARARLRTEILPRIEAGAWPGATEALVRLGSQAAVVSGALESAAAHLLERHARPMPGGGVVIEAAAFRGLDAHLLAEVAAALWRREAWPCRDMTARHYREVAALLAAAADADRAPPAAACFPGDVVATVAGTALRVGRIDRSDRAES